MAQLTKAQLVTQLEAAHVSYQALEAKYEALRASSLASSAPRPRPEGKVLGEYTKGGRRFQKIAVGHNRVLHREVH